MKMVAPSTRLFLAAFTLWPLLAGCTTSHEEKGTTQVEVATSAAVVRVTAPLPGTFRVRLSRSASFQELPSFAVDPGVLTPGTPLTLDTSDPAVVVVRSGAAALRIAKEPLRIALLDGDGQVVAQESAPVAWSDQGATVSWQLPADEHVYGLGDKVGGAAAPSGMDRRGNRYLMWNTDHYQWTVSGPQSDPLYKSIPFMVFVKEGGRAHGLFIDNPSRAVVDVGATDAGVVSYAAERASTMDLYVISGQGPRDVVGAYTALTGRPPLPPRWSLGYHQSRYGYTTEADARQVAAQLRADSIPADAMWLDLHYQEHNAPFTVDRDAFPGFPGMISDFSAAGLHTVLITDEHIRARPGDPQYESGLAGDHFVKNPDGSVLLGGVWPYQNVPEPFRARSAFPEFTLGSARRWWGTLYTTFVSYGVAGFWNDMNEPSIPFDPTLFPEGTMHDDTPHRLDDGTTADHVTLHNAHGLLNARATYEGQLALRPDVRPFVLARAAYAGSQRWGTVWTGDNTANRSHLAVTIPQLVNLGVSGLAFSGADVGGYSGCPYHDSTSGGVDASLLVEWMELGALQPFLRNHSEFGTCRREPWLLGPAVEARLRRAIERRYRLLPYLYTAFEEASRTGLPVMRPLWLEHPADATTLRNDGAYLLGRDLLIAPKLVAGSAPYAVTLPQGAWWDTLTGDAVAGGSVTVTPPADDSVRIFARAGAIVPSQPLTQMAGATPQGALTVEVWPGEDCSGSLYLDDGSSFAFQRGDLRRVAYACQPAADGIAVTSASSGRFPTWWSATRLVIHGASRPASVTGASGPLPWSYDGVAHTVTITFDGGGADWTARATWETAFSAAPEALSLDVGTALPLPATTRPATWAVTGGAGACAVVNGAVQGLSPGTCTLTATCAGDPSRQATATVTVTPYVFQVAVEPTDRTLVRTSDGHAIHQFDRARFVSTRPAEWSATGACTVDDGGLALGVELGSCLVTARSPVLGTAFQFRLTVDPRPASSFVDDYGFPKNVYVKGDFPSFGAGTWSGTYQDMMRLAADHTWTWTWEFSEADAATERIFKLVADQSGWPLSQMFEPDPGDPSPSPDGLGGLLMDEQSRSATYHHTDNIHFTLPSAGVYRITFHEPDPGVPGDRPRYTIDPAP